jgi:hypothetical protein
MYSSHPQDGDFIQTLESFAFGRFQYLEPVLMSKPVDATKGMDPCVELA